MPQFLAGTCIRRDALGATAPRAGDIAWAAAQASRPGAPVWFLGTIAVPAEEARPGPDTPAACPGTGQAAERLRDLRSAANSLPARGSSRHHHPDQELNSRRNPCNPTTIPAHPGNRHTTRNGIGKRPRKSPR